MSVARNVADVLDDHVVFEVESIGRMYLNVGSCGWPTVAGSRASSSTTTTGITMRPRR